MLNTITWPDIVALLQAVFTFLTVMVAFVSMGFNRSIKAVDVSLGCQSRHSDVMEKLYRLPYARAGDPARHPGLSSHDLVSESELFALFNIYWHLIHDEYQYWRDKYITNEMFFRWIDGVFDEFQTNYVYYCRGRHDSERMVTYKELWERVRDHWFHSRSFARFVIEVQRQVDSGATMLDATPLMKFKPRKFRRIGKKPRS
jgi:hypothetical protein